MVYQSIQNVKLLDKGVKPIIKTVIANEASDLKEHYDLIFHKTLAKVQVPYNDEIEEISITYVVQKSISKWAAMVYLICVALNAIIDYEDLIFESVIHFGQIND